MSQTAYPQKRLTSDFKKDEVFVLKEGPYRFAKELSGARMLMQHEHTGHEFPMQEDNLIELLGNGDARRIRQPRDRNGNLKPRAQLPELSIEDYNSPAGMRARALRFYTIKFDEDACAKKGKRFLASFITRWRSEALRRDITTEISPDQLIRAIDACGEPGDRQTRYFVSQQGKTKRNRLHATVERLLQDTVDFYYGERRIVVKDARAYFLDALRLENDERTKKGLGRLVVGKKCEVVRTRINAGINHDNWTRKYSKYEADRKFNGVGDHLKASFAGELVIIDHTVMDGFVLVDSESMLPLGRPWLSFAVDVKAIKSLLNDGLFSVVLAGTEKMMPLLTADSELRSRQRLPIQFSRHGLTTDDCRYFMDFVAHFERQMKGSRVIDDYIGLTNGIESCATTYDMADGVFGIVVRIVRLALERSLGKAEPSITWQDIALAYRGWGSVGEGETKKRCDPFAKGPSTDSVAAMRPLFEKKDGLAA